MTTIRIPPWPVFNEDECHAVTNVLKSGKANYWGGNQGLLFEQEFANWCGTRHGLCVFNGTIALEIAMRSIGLDSGDEIIVTPRSFLASAASVAAIGATPVFADIDFESGNLTAESIAKVITPNTRGILVVHLGGWPADMPSIMKMANENGIKVLEDCAQAHGASIDGNLVGTFGHASTFSFCQDKIMSTGGEGGMILTNEDEVRDIAWSLRDHGRSRSKTLYDKHPFGFRWTQDRIGTNARMTEMQATIGRCQLHKIENWLQLRHDNATKYAVGLEGISGVHIPYPSGKMNHAYYRQLLIVENTKQRDKLIAGLNAVGIPATTGPCPEIYNEEAFVNLGYCPATPLPIASKLGKRSIVLLTHPGMETAIPFIIDQIKQLIG